MAAVINKRDAALQAASPRTITVNLGASVNVNGTVSGDVTGTVSGTVTGNVTGKLNGTSVTTVVNAALNATANYFTQGFSDPSGGSNGDAYYNLTTNTMWFKISGSWTIGGTINANQITTGTLAAARIAALSIDSTKLAAGSVTAGKVAALAIDATNLNVSSLSAITANLGSVTAGSITGSANINISGTGSFNGVTSSGYGGTAILANSSQTALNGIIAYGNSGSGGDAVSAIGSGLATALYVEGRMQITSTTLVSNLNADMVDGYHAASFAKLSGGNTFSSNQFITGDLDVSGLMQCNDLRIDKTPTTGSSTGNYPGNNKPGSTSSNSWLQINLNGSTYYIPVWT